MSIRNSCKVVSKKIKTNAHHILNKFKPKKTRYREITNYDLDYALKCYLADRMPQRNLTDEQLEDLDDRMARLDKDEMTIIRLYYYEGKTQEEIGILFGHDHSWVCRQVQRCLGIMRDST